MHVWRALQMTKYSGQALDIDGHLPLHQPGSLVVPCFACPEPGFNMEEEINDEELQHIETLFLSADGHFGLPRKLKVDDPDDISLTEGQAFFPSEEECEHYLQHAKDATEVCLCST